MLFDAIIIFSLLLLIFGSAIYAGMQVREIWQERER